MAGFSMTHMGLVIITIAAFLLPLVNGLARIMCDDPYGGLTPCKTVVGGVTLQLSDGIPIGNSFAVRLSTSPLHQVVEPTPVLMAKEDGAESSITFDAAETNYPHSFIVNGYLWGAIYNGRTYARTKFSDANFTDYVAPVMCREGDGDFQICTMDSVPSSKATRMKKLSESREDHNFKCAVHLDGQWEAVEINSKYNVNALTLKSGSVGFMRWIGIAGGVLAVESPYSKNLYLRPSAKALEIDCKEMAPANSMTKSRSSGRCQ